MSVKAILTAAQAYLDVTNGVGLIQSWMCAFESILLFYALLACRGRLQWALIAIVSMMSWCVGAGFAYPIQSFGLIIVCFRWKTVYYFGSEAIMGFPQSDLSDPAFWSVLILPATPWMFVPLLVCRRALQELCKGEKLKGQ